MSQCFVLVVQYCSFQMICTVAPTAQHTLIEKENYYHDYLDQKSLKSSLFIVIILTGTVM